MRFAAVATFVAAVAAAPFAMEAASGRMSEDQFVASAECLAFTEVSGGSADAALAQKLRGQIAFEQTTQSPEALARARAEIQAVGRMARAADASEFQLARDAACGTNAAAIANRPVREGRA